MAKWSSVGFSALACAGVVAGRDWRLLLVPLAIVPLQRLIGVGMSSDGMASDSEAETQKMSALREATHAGITTALACPLAVSLASGGCPWSAGAMAAAMASLAVAPPLYAATRHRGVRIAAMLSAAALYAASGFVPDGCDGMVAAGTVVGFPGFIAVRVVLAARDRRRVASA